MDDEDDVRHDTDRAFVTESEEASAASWNPAFRKNSLADDGDDDFYGRYTEAPPRKDVDVAQMMAEEQDARKSEPPLLQELARSIGPDEVPQPIDPSQSPSGILSNLTQGEDTTYGYEAETEVVRQQDDEVPILDPEKSAAQQDEALEVQMPDDQMQDLEGDDGVVGVSEDPAERYDYQGEVTEMEQALEPSAEASLLADEEPLPTADLSSREATLIAQTIESELSLPGSPAPRETPTETPSMPPSLDRSFTTNFSEAPVPSTKSHVRNISQQWPSYGDDKTFGGLLGEPEQMQEWGLSEAVAAKAAFTIAAPDLDLIPEDDAEEEPTDLAAAWGAVLDDDDILEETSAAFDPSQVFGEDDDGFLEDEPAPSAVIQPAQNRGQILTAQSRPQNLQQSATYQQSPTIHSPQFFAGGDHGRSAGTPSTGLFDLHDQYSSDNRQSQQPQRPGTLQQQGHLQSFSDKSKGGYQSPYDLPMDVVKPRRRQQQQIPQQPTPRATPGPPPRSSSISTPTGEQPNFSALLGAPQSLPPIPAATISPPNSRGSTGPTTGAPPPASGNSSRTPSGNSGFFEELPMTAKPRVRPSMGVSSQTTPNVPTLASQQRAPMSPPRVPQNMYNTSAGPISPPRRPNQQQQGQQYNVAPAQAASQQLGGFAGLRQPDRMPLLPEQPQSQSLPAQTQTQQVPPINARYSPQSNAPAPPAVQSRYSPVPTSTGPMQPPAVASRYSPAPAAQPLQAKPRHTSAPAVQGLQQSSAFAPRTSSPLAGYADSQPSQMLNMDAPGIAARPLPSSPPKINGFRSGPSANSSPSRNLNSDARVVETSQQFGPPLLRPQTRSPDAAMRPQRPTRGIAEAITSTQQASQSSTHPSRPALAHRRQFSRDFTFAAPQDERSMDPLQRWKGHPVFKWTAGGSVLWTFPKHTPFYSAGQGLPSMKCTPGPITVQDASQFMPMEERNAKFPGPLAARSKGKKKDVMAWMVAKIEDLERQTEQAAMDFSLPADLQQRKDEKLVLWRIMQIFLENDGSLEGGAKIEGEVRKVLLPNLAQMAQVAELQSPGSATVHREDVDMSVTLQLRQALLEGHRERAVWLAEEKKLWGHAMLIASTMGPDTWKQIVGAFVRAQVKSFGSDARSLAALYQVFAGNSDECVDELVPPSARAGFQMINMADGSVSGNPLEGLDQWREMLDLIVSNRTANDAASLISLGKLLASYGRVEAAHTCYLFAKGLVKHSGADNADADFVLLGANHQSTSESLGGDLDSILLTEIYEYATSLSAPSAGASYIPHLQAFKLVHAQELATFGLKTKAQAYCDAITSAYTSTTRPSPYYHPVFTQPVADMQAFLSQTPHDGKTGLFSRPAMNKVSSGAASWFTKFVAGDDDQRAADGTPSGTAGDQGGPFGGVNSGSGTISRTESTTDLYNPMMGGMPSPAPLPQAYGSLAAPSRYAPGSQAGLTKYGSPQQHSAPTMPSVEPQRGTSSRYAPPPSTGSSLGVPGLARKVSDYSLRPSSSRRDSGPDTSSQGSYEPKPMLADQASPYGYSPMLNSPPTDSPAVGSPLVLPQPMPPTQDQVDPFEGTNGLPEQLDVEDSRVSEDSAAGYLAPSAAYEPPSYTYQPYEAEPDSPEEAKPKRKTYGDEDEDDISFKPPAADAKRAQADREADELVRKAAEADAARDNEKNGQKKKWFGGWWGGGAPRDATASPGPIKAKLGEENSFYYDETLKKWVNKKAGPGDASSASSTPMPPPKGPPSRVVSAALGPPSAPPSRSSSAGGLGQMRPPTSGSGMGPPSGPPSRSGTPAPDAMAPPLTAPVLNGKPAALLGSDAVRPSSSLSNASSIDDLLGGPAGTRSKGGTVKSKKKGRYVDVMAK